MTQKDFRDLPSVDALVAGLESPLPRPLLVDVARTALDEARRLIAEGTPADPARSVMAMLATLERSAGARIVNATGVLLHTNLGRARWSADSVDRAMAAASHATNLEVDTETGARSRRGEYVTRLVTTLTGGEDALIVNNNAAAVMLALAATSSGRAVPVSRGELIEIGGSYRLPEVIAASGAQLVEVGTTNRTRAGDYQTALQTHTCGSILKIHPSNYRVEGFTESTSVVDLAELAKGYDVHLIFDIGSGLLDAETPWLAGPTPAWLRDEPAARQSLAEGADLVTFSADKLLGGPQAGVIVGSAEAVQALRTHPMARALRVDGVTLAALAATLEAFLAGDVRSIPFWQQALTSTEALAQRVNEAAQALGGKVQEKASAIGAGSVPGVAIPTPVLVLEGEDSLFGPLLAHDPPILARREEGALVIDLRTVDDDQEVIDAIQRCR